MCLAGRPAVAVKLQDAVAVLMHIMQQSSSPEALVSRVGYARHASGGVLFAMKEVAESCQIGGIDLTTQLLSCGYVDVLVSGLSAIERVGAENVNVHKVALGMMLLKVLDGEALGEIEDRLRAIPSALRYLKDSKIENIAEFGLTSGTLGTIVAAALHGRDEVRFCVVSNVMLLLNLRLLADICAGEHFRLSTCASASSWLLGAAALGNNLRLFLRLFLRPLRLSHHHPLRLLRPRLLRPLRIFLRPFLHRLLRHHPSRLTCRFRNRSRLTR
jgi:hypothetical protein